MHPELDSDTPELDSRRVEMTDRFLRSLRPQASIVEYRDAATRGLILRLLPSGVRQWSVRYRHAGKQRRAVLGEYPTLRLAKARIKASRTLLAARDGADPAAEQQARKRKPTDTVSALADEYLKRHARPNKRTADEDERVIDVEIRPALGDKSVRALTRRDIRAVLDRIVDRGSPVMANRVLAVIRKMLNYAIDTEWIDANPAARMPKPARETSRDRVLTDDEIRALWRLLSRQADTHEKPAPGRASARRRADDDPICPIGPALAAAWKVRLLTAQRGGEVIRMRWADLDLAAGWWTIPSTDTKNGEPHRVPLTADVIAIIKAQRSEPHDPDAAPYVFAGRFGNVVEARAKKASAALARVLGFAFRGHDLRRTAATRMAAAGVPQADIAAVLNHVEGGPRATRVYVRYQRDAEKRRALETWARELRRILTPEPQEGAEIVPMRRA